MIINYTLHPTLRIVPKNKILKNNNVLIEEIVSVKSIMKALKINLSYLKTITDRAILVDQNDQTI